MLFGRAYMLFRLSLWIPAIPDPQPNASQLLRSEFAKERALELSQPDYQFRDGLLTIIL
jgi:hypothetical protein